MAQGYSAYNIISPGVTIKDSPNLDAFSRLRVSNPLILHNSQFTYDLAPLIFEQITLNTGASISHSVTNRCANLAFSSTATGGKCYMQSYEYLPYQPGRSQLAMITFNMVESMANVLKFAGYSDGVNGVEFQLNGTTKQFVIYSGTNNGNQTVAQSSWNLDKLDGTGASGITLDITKTQILVIDIQALYVGRVRIGFDIGGIIIYAHEFKHANLATTPYIQTANLPVRCGMTCTGTVSTTMNFVCSAVISEGGSEDISTYAYSFETNTVTTTSTAGVLAMTLRPKTLFNNIVNRMKVSYIDVEVFNTGTTNQHVKWELLVGQPITGGTWSDVSGSSGLEVNTTATATTETGVTPIVIDAGWAGVGANTSSVINVAISSRYPITLNQAGGNRTYGSITLKLTSLSGSPVVYSGIKYREIR